MIEIADARREPSTPMMTTYLRKECASDEAVATRVARSIGRVKLDDVSRKVDNGLQNELESCGILLPSEALITPGVVHGARREDPMGRNRNRQRRPKKKKEKKQEKKHGSA